LFGTHWACQLVTEMRARKNNKKREEHIGKFQTNKGKSRGGTVISQGDGLIAGVLKAFGGEKKEKGQGKKVSPKTCF